MDIEHQGSQPSLENELIISEESKQQGGCVASIRKERVNPVEYSADYEVGTEIGINFFTDSSTLAENVASTEDVGTSKDSTDLVYLTKSVILPVHDETQPKKIDKGMLGDLIVTPDLKHYAISGPEKYGSAISILFGISSFEKAEEGILGLHAGQIYDKKLDLNHIIIGASGQGKSTYTHLLSAQEPNRFDAVADDWVELDTNNRTVNPISKTFGSHRETVADDIISASPRITSSFESFQKKFSQPEIPKDISPRVGMIFQLYEGGLDKSDNGLLYLLSGVNSHIPFLYQFQLDDSRINVVLPKNVCSRLEAIITNYTALARGKRFEFINARKGDIHNVAARMIDEIDR